MIRLILPLLFFIGAGSVAYFLVEPLIYNPLNEVEAETGFKQVTGGIIALRQEKQVAEKAIADARDLRGRLGELQTAYEQISTAEINRLDSFLPARLDDLPVIVDIDRLARLSEMEVEGVSVESSAEARVETRDFDELPQQETLDISFTVNGTYDQMKQFLNDLASSLRILSVKNLSFNSPTGDSAGETTFNFTIQTYWLR
ncbi:MAG: type 4a pilus biogenesis protein PilO [Patescibacteria group bacterium]